VSNFAGCRYLQREPRAADTLLTSAVASRGYRNWSLDLSFQNRCASLSNSGSRLGGRRIGFPIYVAPSAPVRPSHRV